MKTLLLILALLLALALPACIPPIVIIDRTTLVENLDLVLRLEEKMGIIQQKVNFLAYLGVYSEELALKMKKHHDAYYPYYLVANLYLAHGQLEKYREAVRSAESELDAMDKLIQSVPPSNRSVF